MASSNLKQLASQKEKEWKEITDLRIQTLEAENKEKSQILEDERQKFVKLKEDFKYNLKLLGERDKELEHYDVLFKEFRQKITKVSTDNSELNIKMDDLNTALAREATSREDLQIHYQQRLREKQKEINNFTRTKDGEVEKERKEYESFKRKLERRLTELEEELELQRRELTTGFDDAMKKREHEFRVKLDEMSSQVLAHQLKAKLLAKELEMINTAQGKTSEEFQVVESNHKELENRLKKKDWELADLKSVKESQISELKGNLSRSEAMLKKFQEDYEQRYADMDKYGREKEASLTRLKEYFIEKEESYKDSLQQLQTTLQKNQVELRQLTWTSQDLIKEKDIQVERLCSELSDLKEKWEHQVIDLSRDQVSRDVQYEDMRGQVQKLNIELMERKQDISRYKKELSSALERESSLERSKAQLELDWQRRYEDVERVQYSKSEELVAKLTTARDQALASLKEKGRECEDQRQVIHQLRTGNHSNQNNLSLAGSEFLEMEELRIQNKNLTAAIGEMRSAMEELGHDVTVSPANQITTITVTKDYTQSLEKEVCNLKKENRDLKQRLDLLKKPEASEYLNKDPSFKELKDNTVIQSHIQSLNDDIGTLRAEKIDLTAQLKKQQARLQHFNKSTDNASKQLREKQLEIDQIQYELNAEKRRQKAELAGLKQRQTELELELTETRKEADEYYRASLQTNMEVTTLRAEVSNLKLELAQKRPGVNFGAQELVIQQLEDELNHLKKHSAVMTSDPVKPGQGLTTNATLEQLQNKLKSAAKHITQLARDKQHLIEIGNRQRAELIKAGIPPPSASSRGGQRVGEFIRAGTSSESAERPLSPVSVPNPQSLQLSDRIQDKLYALEKLQYQLTKQELQYAQKFSPHRSAGLPRTARSKNEEPNEPVSILKKSTESFQSEAGFGVSSLADGRTDDELMMTLTSAGGDSLQDIWQVLNQASPSPVPSKHNIADVQENSSGNSTDWLIKGKKAGVVAQQQSRPTKDKQKRPSNTRKPTQKSKVRNYNISEDAKR